MRNHVYTMITLAVLSSVCSASGYDDFPSSEPKTVKSSGGFLKTAIVGALMALSPAPVEAQNPTFVGSYLGRISTYGVTDSNNISIGSMYFSNYNNFYTNPISIGNSFPYVKVSGSGNDPIKYMNAGNFTMKTECKDRSCDEISIKAIRLCNKTFDVNYDATMKYNPTGIIFGLGPSYPNVYGPYLYPTTDYYQNFSLSVWESKPALNTTTFEKTFNSVMINKTCNVSTTSTNK